MAVNNGVNRKYRLKPVVIGNNNVLNRASVEPSAVLHIDDIDGGFLLSRMTTTQRNAIVSPATGLQVYNTSTNAINIFNGVTWGALGGGGGGPATGSLVDTTLGTTGTFITGTGISTDTIDFKIAGVPVMTIHNNKVSFNGVLLDPPAAIEVNQLTAAQFAVLPFAVAGGANAIWIDSITGHLHRGSVDLETGMKKQQVVANIAARDAIVGSASGDIAYVIDASSDITVNAGAALYVHDGLVWKKIAEFESLDITANNFKGVWSAATAYLVGDIAIIPSGALVQRSAAGTSGTAYNVTEAANWTLLQNGANQTTFPASQYIYAGQTYYDSVIGKLYERKTSGVSLANIAIDGVNWTSMLKEPVEFVIANAVAAWGTAAAGSYTITVPAATHGISAPKLVQVWRDVVGGRSITMTDTVVIDTATKDIKISVTEIPDGRFAGAISIA